MKKKIWRGALWITLAVILAGLAVVLSFDSIARVVAEKRLRAETGMDVHIGHLSVGLRNSSVHIENLVVQNPNQFGGGTFVKMPELFLEYDRAALRAGKLSLKLVRVDISELHIVENKQGQKNIDGLQKPPALKTRSPRQSAPAETNGVSTEPFAFDGIELLDVSLDSIKFTSEKNPDQNLDLHFGSDHELFKNLKTELDFQTAGLVLFLKAGLSGSLDFESLFSRRGKRERKVRHAATNAAEILKPISTTP